MTAHSLVYAGVLAAGILAGCATPKTGSFAFLGIPESESSNRDPVGLINGKPCQVRDVTPVSETTYQQYEASRRAGRIFTEATHGDYIYYATKVQRDVRFDNASAWVEVVERFKARKP